VTTAPVQELLITDCARTKRRVALNPDMVRVTFRVARAARDQALKMAEDEGTTLSELTRDCWYEARGIGELEGD
jgi:hypothetical protein